MEYNRFRDVDYRINRFWCDCGWASHVLEVSEDLDCRVEDRHIEIAIYIDGNDGFFRRLWTAIKHVFGKRIACSGEIVINSKDRADLAEAILPEKLE